MAQGAAAAMIRGFDTISADDRSQVGGKGLQLGQLTQAGFAVPEGFCVTTVAYSAFLASGIGAQIKAISADADYEDPTAVEHATSQIRELVLGADMGPSLEGGLRDAYDNLGADSFVAVRSSATAEDMPGASFAGLHDTFLDVRGYDDLAHAVKRCWASGWTARAAAYRHAQEFEHDEMMVAVVVQKMIASEISGVMFTGNPVTNSEDEIVINASWGLGEAIVSGITQPDEFILEKATGRIKDRTLGSKAIAIERDDERGIGTIEKEVPVGDRERYSVTDEQVDRLAALGRSIEESNLGIPQDIEWAIVDDEIFVLQSRDITGAAFPYAEGLDRWQADLADDPDTVWTRKMADEYYTGPFTPLFYSVRGYDAYVGGILAYSEGFGYRPRDASKKYFRWINARMYANSSELATDMRFFLPPDALPEALQQVPEELRGEATNLGEWGIGLMQGYMKFCSKHPELALPRWIDSCEISFTEAAQEIAAMREIDLTRLSDEDLCAHLDRVIELFVEHIEIITVGFFVYIPVLTVALSRMLFTWIDEPITTLGTLLSGVEPTSPTTLENIAVYELAQEFRQVAGGADLLANTRGEALLTELQNRADAKELARHYADFLRDHGHRGHADRDFRFPRWGDEPENLSVVLRAMLNVAEENEPRAAERRAVTRQRETAAEVRQRLDEQANGDLLVQIFDFVIRHLHAALHLRDQERFEADKMTWEKRRAVVELGSRLVVRGQIEDPDDVYFLSREEIYELLAEPVPRRLIDAKVASRRRVYERHREAPVFWAHGGPLELDAPDDDNGAGLRGAGTSPGVVTGTARVVASLDEISRLRQGDILITNSTDPGWTSAFLLISGLVLETGGMLAHGSLLSREYGLPAVTSIEGALDRIPDGATVKVDGTRGIVEMVVGDA